MKLTENIICTSFINCWLCRATTETGKSWRRNVLELFESPDGLIDFACPFDKPWLNDDFLPSNEKQVTLTISAIPKTSSTPNQAIDRERPKLTPEQMAGSIKRNRDSTNFVTMVQSVWKFATGNDSCSFCGDKELSDLITNYFGNLDEFLTMWGSAFKQWLITKAKKAGHDLTPEQLDKAINAAKNAYNTQKEKTEAEDTPI